MPPRRAANRKAAGPSAGSSTVMLPPVTDVGSAVDEALLTWVEGGSDKVQQLLASLLDQATSTPLSSIPLSHCFVKILESDLTPAQVHEVCSALIDSFEEERKQEQVSSFAEALVDIVEVLEESKEDVTEPQAQAQTQDRRQDQMEVDTQVLGPGQKGVEVIKLLMVRPANCVDRISAEQGSSVGIIAFPFSHPKPSLLP